MVDRPSGVLFWRLLRAALVFAAVMLAGTLGYWLLGQGRWTVLDSAYMVVITISTVGYGEVLDDLATTPWARPLTVLLIVAGTGTMLYLTSAVTAFIIEGDLRGYLRRRQLQRAIEELTGHQVLCGLGNTGRHLMRAVRESGEPCVGIDTNEDKLARWDDEQGLVILGDATEEDVLRQAGIERARGLVASLSDDRDNLFLVFTARSMNPRLRIVAKAVDPSNEAKLRRAGADDVVSPARDGGRRLAASLLTPGLTRLVRELVERPDAPRVHELTLSTGDDLVGRRVGTAELRTRLDGTLLAIRSDGGAVRYNPPAEHLLAAGETLVLLVDR